jgi:hypothetical protein
VFYENGQLIPLQTCFTENGVRYLTESKRQHLTKMIKGNAEFLSQQIQTNGRFIYGFFQPMTEKFVATTQSDIVRRLML